MTEDEKLKALPSHPTDLNTLKVVTVAYKTFQKFSLYTQKYIYVSPFKTVDHNKHIICLFEFFLF